MGQCTGKDSQKSKTRNSKLRDLPPNSPLGEILENWESESSLKGLDKIKMIKYYTEV